MTALIYGERDLETDVDRRLGVIGIGISLLTYALQLVVPQVPPLGVAGAVAVATAVVYALWRRYVPPAGPAAESARARPVREERQLLADHGRHVVALLRDLSRSRERAEPGRIRGALIPGSRARWERKTSDQYEERIRQRAVRFFDRAVRLGAVSPTIRSSFDSPTVAEIALLADLSERIVERLEGR